ncbi:PRC-barrel domain-containing protein [Lyngbya confervoides]|uniref:PRC-barrel domain-containing protein n=1 Tax=Lyngbya confervoides BDU141951 TaxID=1574623 RepID=A0ABD4T9C1_9CYAN|nr:PRC-barrel domain-containing protein [Lyngbya confervoides]MCM1985383.1 PRC-barrel domain-containing protein [Lyngbya confervoides BDU141951]
MAISDPIQQRSDLIGTQVITRNSGRKLGVVNQMWVDVDQREVVALGVRSTLVTGEQRYMLLTSVKQIGDVVLVEDENAIEPVDIYGCSTIINHEVVTETGELLGKVRGFKFDPNTGHLTALVIASLGLPLIPSQVISTYELPIDEIVSSGPDRIIVFEGAEERVNQLTVGLMERLGLSTPPWESDMEDYIPTTVSTSNQLASGTRPTYAPPRQEEREKERVRVEDRPLMRDEYLERDAWADEGEAQEDQYEAQPLNLPERQKIAEYEREPDY